MNAKAIYFLQCAIDRNKYNRVCQCKLAKEIWRLLKVTYEETNQVKESKINLLIHSSTHALRSDFQKTLNAKTKKI